MIRSEIKSNNNYIQMVLLNSLTLPVDPSLYMGFLIAWRIFCFRASSGEL